MASKPAWIDPDFQVSGMELRSGGDGHLCIMILPKVDNENHFGFTDMEKARLFATSILEVVKSYVESKRR